MRARWLLGPLALAVAAALIAGCGAGKPADPATPAGKHLTIYSSLPLPEPEAVPIDEVGDGDSYAKAEAEVARVRSAQQTHRAAEEVLAGERLALHAAHGHVGRYDVSLVSLNDSGSSLVKEDEQAEANAKLAVKDTHTIAYIGDYESGASAVSLPLTNAAEVLQVSPVSPYVGLTSAFDAGQDDPERFYPSGQHSFVRLLPGDIVQAAAQVALMQSIGVRKVYVLSDGEPFEAPLAAIVAGDAKSSGVEVAGEAAIEVAHANAETSFEKQIQPIRESGAEAVFFSGEPSAASETLWTQLHEEDPSLPLLGSAQLAEPSFAKAIGRGAARMTYLATPMLPKQSYPASAQRVLAEFRHRYGATPTPEVLCGYAAMSLVLAAIKAAGDRGDDREAVVKAALSAKSRKSVLGAYSVLASGETTLTRYAIDRISDGAPVFWHELDLGETALRSEHVP